MLNKKPNMFVQDVHYAYSHDARKIVRIATDFTVLLCDIPKQFNCEFIDNNTSHISFISDIAKLIKLPISILYILDSGLNLAGYGPQNKEEDKYKPKEPLEIVSELSLLIGTIIRVLNQIIYLLAKDGVSYMGFASTILCLFISEPRLCCIAIVVQSSYKGEKPLNVWSLTHFVVK
ncbi:MAG: hypothetical protein ACR5K9_11535 [Wolbachia sp.]